jgi:acetyl esterase
MPLHPTIQGMLDRVAGLPPLHTFTPEQIRATDLARYAAVPLIEVGHVQDRMIAGPLGDLKIRIYRPDMADGHPVVTFFHGSGFVICSIDTHDGLCRQICMRAKAVVVSVDYALAPEKKFPAAPNDCHAATLWVARNAQTFGGDPNRHVLAGDSAGGNLAAVTALRLRDEAGPPIKAQILMYPVTDYHTPGTPSYVERASGYGLGADGMKYFWAHYLNDASEGLDPRASPLRAASVAGLPPTYVITAEYDPLRDEGEAFAARLRQAGVDTALVRYPDVNHGFMSWVGVIDRSGEALNGALDWLRSRV